MTTSSLCSPPSKRQRTSRSSLGGSIDWPEAEELKVGIREPKQQSQYYERGILREYLFGKYKTGKIYVDSETVCPKKVWFLRRTDSCPNEDNAYEICYPKEELKKNHHAEIESYVEKWKQSAHAGTSKQSDKMCTMMSMCDALADCLQWRFNEATDYGWNLDLGKQQVYEMELEKISNEGHQDLATLLGFGNFPSAMREAMTDAVGRHAISALFECAAIIVFGGDYRKAVAVYPVGTSRAPRESFPVSLATSARNISDVHYDLRLTEDAKSDKGAEVGEKSSSTSGFWEDGELYADVLVASGHKPNWPRFLFVVELNGEHSYSIRHKAQLMREMLAGIMHQTLVFGLIINSMGASLYDMHHDFEHKKIHVNVKNYLFQDDNVSRNFNTKFNATEFKNLFIDIVAAMEYGQRNIKEINHGF